MSKIDDITALVNNDIALADRLRAALQNAITVVANLQFECGWPVDGMDAETTIVALQDLMPHETYNAIWDRAQVAADAAHAEGAWS
jgi:phage terminase large subunit-like protein